MPRRRHEEIPGQQRHGDEGQEEHQAIGLAAGVPRASARATRAGDVDGHG
jgi:hypothetical protein